jgi:hypothetical protein
VNRIWIGPRMLVREGETEGFVADEIPATGVGCPIAWRAEQLERTSGTNAWATAWFADHPEFRALATLAGRVTTGVVATAQELAVRRSPPAAEPSPVRTVTPVTAAASANHASVVSAPADSAAHAPRHETAPADTLDARHSVPAPADTLHAPHSVPAPAESAKAD